MKVTSVKAKITIRTLMAIAMALILFIIFYPLFSGVVPSHTGSVIGIGAFSVTALAETVLGIF